MDQAATRRQWVWDMANSAASSGQIISLPKGGGALRGIGETFSPDLFTGTGNFSVPISLPPGRGGFQPELSLVYSTGSGNGPFGLGWSLGIPGVSRKTSKGVPRYDDAKDTFLLSGAEDLVPVETQGTSVRYQPRTEGLFARIFHRRERAQNFWEVWSKDGLKSRYGTDNAVIADPADLTRIFLWKLTETLDPFGNRIIYTYDRDAGVAGPHQWDQLYLRDVRYAEYAVAPNKEQFLVSVTFEYQELPDQYPDNVPAPRRIYPFSEYRSGFEIRTRKRCERIVVRTHAEDEHLVRTYELVYLDERDSAGELPETVMPRNGVSLLSEIRVIGHDERQVEEADRTEMLPPLEFCYTPFEPEGRDFFPLAGDSLPAQSLASPDLELADLFGNGLPDILQMNGTVRYWRNLGGGRFDLPRDMQDAPAGLQLADPDVQLIDANGDGRIDVLTTTNGLSGYFPLTFKGVWDRRSFQRYRQAPSFSLEDPEVNFVDLNGDGVTDAVRSGSRFEYFFNDAKEGWNGTRRVERRDLEVFPNVNFSDPRVRWADMTGDGLQDIVLVYDGNVEYWPNLGHGNWGWRIHMRNSPRFSYGYDPRRILIGDIDGDGLADLVYVDHRRVVLYLNQGGNGWSDPVEIDGTPPVTDMDSVRLVDMLGTGTAGVLWSAEANGQGRPHLYFLDFTGGLKPYLMNEMDNHMGAVTRVEYAPSTQFYFEDEQHPRTRWKTPLPFPVQVVARVEVVDELSRGKLTTEYRYRHGYWDGAEREFRGFGRVDQRDTEVFETYHAPGLHPEREFEPVAAESFSPPTETRTWFHQGPLGEEHGAWYEADYSDEYWAGDPILLERPAAMQDFLKHLPRRAKRDALRTLRGSIPRTELYALDGTVRETRPYTITESLYGVREEAVPSIDEGNRLRIFFPHALAQRTTQWERGDEPLTQFSFTGDYDPYGQPCSQIAVALPRWRGLDLAPKAALPSDGLTAMSEHERQHTAALERYLATQTVTDFAYKQTEDVYIVNHVARATTFEVETDGKEGLFALKDSIENGTASRLIIGQTVNFYDGEAFIGLPFKEIGEYGALVRSESLVLTDDILEEAYPAGTIPPDRTGWPLYLESDTPDWSAEYPQAFREAIPVRAGYAFYPGDAVHARGYSAATARHRYDFHDSADNARGLLRATMDPLGYQTNIEYDLELLPSSVTDPAGLTTRATYDLRVLQPREMEDPNGNHTRVAYTPLGLVKHTAVTGKKGETVGDTDEVPGTRFKYDFFAFEDSPPEARQPVSVGTIQREHHVSDTDVPLTERDETIETVEYSDGFGRLLQTRTQAEEVLFGDPIFGDGVLPTDQSVPPGDVIGHVRTPEEPLNVVASGWQTYDNKGRVVEQFEPFFDKGWDYLARQVAHDERPEVFGRKVRMNYDPRGQVIRTVNPDGSEQRVLYGVPGTLANPDLSNPDVFEPTPWEAYTYDANDLAPLSTSPDDPSVTLADQAPAAHHFTPASIVIDALGRTVQAVERNGLDRTTDWFVTRSTYDIRGNLLSVIDALEREAFQYTYDLTDRPLRIESIDAGLRRIVLDAVGGEIERRDSKGALILQAYDVLNRPLRRWARDDAESSVTLREQIVYGDNTEEGLPEAEAQVANLRGQLYRHYDEAGRLTVECYDFKGNVLEKVRQVISDDQILSVFDSAPPDWKVQAFRVDWQPPESTSLGAHATALLDPFAYRTSATYDALNRVKVMHYPEDEDQERKVLRPRYNRAGGLERVVLESDAQDDTTYVEHIAYNAKGQRTFIAFGNGVMTLYAYNPHTFRVARLQSGGYTKPDPAVPTYEHAGNRLQDFGYAYDLIGNITAIHDRTPDCGVGGKDVLDRAFTYNPIYRLVFATGREYDADQQAIPLPPWLDVPTPQDQTKTRAYTRDYRYDKLGNLEELGHNRGQTSAFVRVFDVGPDNNRLNTLTANGTTFRNAYDTNGNLIRENTERHFEWDHSDQMKAFRNQVEGSEPSVHLHYLYDASGQRVKKLVRKQSGGLEATVYVDGIFEHHHWQRNGESPKANNRLHVVDDQHRVALVRVGAVHPDDKGPKVQYHLDDHLGSSNVVIDGQSNPVNREEYTPYGETSFGGFARKRYRFTGKERDEESGLSYHWARYYLPWQARWASCDPLGRVDGVNIYQFARGNPSRFIDPRGEQSTSVEPVVIDSTDIAGTEGGDEWIQSYEDGSEWPQSYEESSEWPQSYENADRDSHNSPTCENISGGADARTSGRLIKQHVDWVRIAYDRLRYAYKNALNSQAIMQKFITGHITYELAEAEAVAFRRNLEIQTRSRIPGPEPAETLNTIAAERNRGRYGDAFGYRDSAHLRTVKPSATTTEIIRSSGRTNWLATGTGVMAGAVGVVGTIALMSEAQDVFARRRQVELQGLKASDFDVGHEFDEVTYVENNRTFQLTIRVERNIIFRRKFYVVRAVEFL